MKKVMTATEISQVEARLKHFEAETGCELLLVVTDTCDPYPAAPWRFGVISSFMISLLFTHYFEFHTPILWPVSFFLLLLFMTWLGHYPWAKRLTLSSWEVERECKEKALELFHTMGTSQVSHKVTAMILVSLLEREIEVLVDEKLKEKIHEADLKELIGTMKENFSKGQMGLGLERSIERLEKKILEAFKGRVATTNPSELKDTIQFINLNPV